ncbi:MAG: MSMEG_1061 family FMN-dependent PPOX-type flavoprotein [Pseudomonadota bacterium]
MYQPSDVVTSVDEIRAVIPGEFFTQTSKMIDHIDPLIRAWIERTTFITVATVDAAGGVDVSPKGDPAGFVRVVDEVTLAIPDRPGNHRFDSFRNILQTGRIGVMFMVPNRNEVVRVIGSAQVVRDLPLRESLSIKGRVPEFAILVRVEKAFFHCGKAIIRSRLWHPQDAQPIDGLPTYAEALIAHGKLDVGLDYMEARLHNNDTNRLYDE